MIKGYKRERADKILFTEHFDFGIIITQICIDYIVFGSTSQSKVHEFFNQMSKSLK